jgi:hypothetical protein
MLQKKRKKEKKRKKKDFYWMDKMFVGIRPMHRPIDKNKIIYKTALTQNII